jgi:2-hydroxychromene-2-carboxylate isomerase
MPSPIDYYFDFSSPYGYLISDQIDDFAARHGREVAWHPVLLGVIFQKTGTKPLSEIPLKGAYARHDWDRFARLLGVPYRHPERFPIPTQAAARVFYWVHDRDPREAKALARALYHAYFEHGQDISNPAKVVEIANRLGHDGRALTDALKSEALKERVKGECEAAVERGVFGSPFLIVDGEPFWGSDRLWQVKRWLDRGGW